MYKSEKILPYVYKCVNRNSNEFYIGYRGANTVPSTQDLPLYKTSSKLVRPIFDQFEWYIIAEFFDPHDAFLFEQELIQQNIHDPLNLNRNIGGQCCWNGKKHTTATKQKMSKNNHMKTPESREKASTRLKGRIFTDQHKKNISVSKLGVKASNETKEKLSIARKGKFSGNKNNFYGKKHSEESKRKISETNKGRVLSDEVRARISLANKRPKEKNCICIYCGKVADAVNISRWHNDKCKFNPNIMK